MKFIILTFILFSYCSFGETTLSVYEVQDAENTFDSDFRTQNLESTKRNPASLVSKKARNKSNSNERINTNHEYKKKAYQENYGDYELEILNVIDELENDL